MIDEDDRKARDKAERRRNRLAEQQFRADVQEMMGSPAARRVLNAFIAVAGIDLSAYRDTAHAMTLAVAWQDAARWWLHAIREHCPERETQMRAEANRDAREGTTDEATDHVD